MREKVYKGGSMGVELEVIGQQARTAAHHLLRASTEQKDSALHALADLLNEQQDAILDANAADMQRAESAGLGANLLDRMLLTPQRLIAMAGDVHRVAQLPDPVGDVFESTTLPSGLRLHRQRTPIGVLAMVYEARPNVTIDAAALCIKTGNAIILRGGSDSSDSCAALTNLVGEALEQVGLPRTAVQSITDPERDLVRQLLHLDAYVDMLIPRGGAGLHRFCREHARMPVMTGGLGICHIYADNTADIEKAVPIIYNAKVQRPSVCNALDTLLVQRDIAPQLLPAMAANLHTAGVAFRADPAALEILQAAPGVVGWSLEPAGDEDFDTEFLGLTLAIRVVETLDDALDHIRQHSTGHTEAILTRDSTAAARFLNEVDSSAVFVNASTRFNDGGQFGLGAEIAVSTIKVHARGPMGLHELTSYKWVGEGDWLVRA